MNKYFRGNGEVLNTSIWTLCLKGTNQLKKEEKNWTCDWGGDSVEEEEEQRSRIKGVFKGRTSSPNAK